MKALITGDRGFVGRHMWKKLDALGWKLSGVDLKDGGDAHKVFQRSDTQWDLVVHCAYHVGGRTAIDGQPDNLHKNILLDSAMFEWALRTKQRHVLYFSSSAAYPTEIQMNPRADVRLAEGEIDLDWIQHPDGRYGFAKLVGEQMARAAAQSGLRVSIVRPFSGYGADQDDTYPFPAFLKRALSFPDTFEIWGSGEQKRDWIHISDVIDASLAVVERDREWLADGYIAPTNLCTGRGISMFELGTMIMDAVGYHADFTVLTDKPLGVLNRVGDPDMMFEVYEPKVSIEQGIADAVQELMK